MNTYRFCLPLVEGVWTVAGLLNGRVVVGEEDRRTLLLLQVLFRGETKRKWDKICGGGRKYTKEGDESNVLFRSRVARIKDGNVNRSSKRTRVLKQCFMLAFIHFK